MLEHNNGNCNILIRNEGNNLKILILNRLENVGVKLKYSLSLNHLNNGIKQLVIHWV